MNNQRPLIIKRKKTLTFHTYTHKRKGKVCDFKTKTKKTKPWEGKQRISTKSSHKVHLIGSN